MLPSHPSPFRALPCRFLRPLDPVSLSLAGGQTSVRSSRVGVWGRFGKVGSRYSLKWETSRSATASQANKNSKRSCVGCSLTSLLAAVSAHTSHYASTPPPHTATEATSGSATPRHAATRVHQSCGDWEGRAARRALDHSAKAARDTMKVRRYGASALKAAAHPKGAWLSAPRVESRRAALRTLPPVAMSPVQCHRPVPTLANGRRGAGPWALHGAAGAAGATVASPLHLTLS